MLLVRTHGSHSDQTLGTLNPQTEDRTEPELEYTEFVVYSGVGYRVRFIFFASSSTRFGFGSKAIQPENT
jgi:hypothetical protein